MIRDVPYGLIFLDAGEAETEMEAEEPESHETEELEDELWLSVFLPTSNPLLQSDGFAPFQSFATGVGHSLEEEDLGYFEGAMTGESIANLSFTLNPAGDGEKAVALVLTRLREVGWERDAIVAKCGFVTRNGKHSEIEEVVWPPDFQGTLPR